LTCIIGVVHEDKVYMGGDSAGVGGYALIIRADEKVFQNGPFLMGFTTSFRMGQLLWYSLSAPAHPFDGNGQPIDTYKYMVTIFINAVRQCLKDGGYASTEKGQEFGGTFLVGYKGKLFMIQDNYQVAESVDNFQSVGCGDEIARGALCVTPDLPPEQRIKLALEAAERYSAGVRGPFLIKELQAVMP
jgi:ATP-dependent protease HslVU (ClpYQ) peptidase subunit